MMTFECLFRHCDIFSYNFIYLFIFGCAGLLLLHVGFSLVAVSRGYSVVAVDGLLFAVASFAEPGP